MTTTTNVKQVKLNVMTKEQYNAAEKNPTELYMVTDADLIANQSGQGGKYLTTNGIDTSWASIDGFTAQEIQTIWEDVQYA